MSKIDIVSFWNPSGNIGMAPYVNTSADGGHIDYEGVYSKVDLNARMQSIVSALPDFFESYTIKLTDVNLSGVLVSKAECVLKASSSESPDYTQVLTRIANALDTNVQDNLINKLQSINEKFINQNENIAEKFQNINTNLGFIRSGMFATGMTQNQGLTAWLKDVVTRISEIRNLLKQSVSPNASITDVISALNATIDSKQDTTIVNNEVTPLAEINIDVPFEVKNLKKSDVENL